MSGALFLWSIVMILASVAFIVDSFHDVYSPCRCDIVGSGVTQTVWFFCGSLPAVCV